VKPEERNEPKWHQVTPADKICCAKEGRAEQSRDEVSYLIYDADGKGVLLTRLMSQPESEVGDVCAALSEYW
jgi:hypothetical protein